MNDYQIFTDATADLSGDFMKGLAPVKNIPMRVEIGGMEKPRGRKKAVNMQLKRMEQGWMPEMGKTVVIGHGDCPEDARKLHQAVSMRFPEAEIYVADIGPVIGAHTGPGMLAVIYWGNTR